MKTLELTGAALDWLVAKCEGLKVSKLGPGNKHGVWLVEGDSWYEKRSPYHPSTDWAQGGPIVERERICLRDTGDDGDCMWEADDRRDSFGKYTGPTPLMAAMRYYVASNLGDEVDVPGELQ